MIQLSECSGDATESGPVDFFQPSPLIRVKSLNSTDDFADLKELSFLIPTQRFQHIVSSTTPRYTANQ